MNREVKFRAWNIFDKERVPFWHCDPSFTSEGELVCLSGNTLMQYTGLKDKNGVEIYEGDIVRASNLIAEVQFMKGGFFLYRGGEDFDLVSNWVKVEVIGNIYENLDLVGKV